MDDQPQSPSSQPLVPDVQVASETPLTAETLPTSFDAIPPQPVATPLSPSLIDEANKELSAEPAGAVPVAMVNGKPFEPTSSVSAEPEPLPPAPPPQPPSQPAPAAPLPASPVPPVPIAGGAPLQPQGLPSQSWSDPAPPPPASPMSKPFKKHRFKLSAILLVFGGLLLLGGGTAGAYFGYYLPNKPENKLAKAIAKTASLKQDTSKGSIDITSKDGTAVAIDYALAADVDANKYSLSGTVGVNGAQFPYDLRYIEKNIYLKVGGLKSLSTLPVGQSYPGLSEMLEAFSSINDQWYVIDRSFLSQGGGGLSCATDLSFALDQADMKKLEAAYKKYPIYKITKTSKATVDGTATTKYDLQPASGVQAEKFFGELKELSLVKKLRACMALVESDSSAIGDVEVTPELQEATTGTVAVYISGDNKLKKVEMSLTQAGNTIKLTQTTSYTTPTIDKPEGAKPFQDIWADIVGSSDEAFETDLKDIERKDDLTTIAATLEDYYANNSGQYPTRTGIATLKGVTEAQLSDPNKVRINIAGGDYAYDPSPAGCTNASATTRCKGYVLTARLNDGTTYVLKSQ